MTESLLFNFDELKRLGGIQAGELISVDPQLFPKYMKHLSRRVKRDEVTKKMVFLTALSAYTPEPINLFLRGESSIGKSYNVTETLRYFPREDVWLLGGLSPTALVHDKGKLVDENGEEIKPEDRPLKPRKTDYLQNRDYVEAVKEYKEKREVWLRRLQSSHYLVELSGKILVFLEAPNIKTFNMLRPILSHDAWQISYKFTDKSAKQTLQTQHVVIQGWPATIFCSTDEKYVRDLATRSFTITPEIQEEKFRQANIVTGEKSAFPWRFDIEKDQDFMFLEGYIRYLKGNLERFRAVIPYGVEFARVFEAKFPRSMRDFKHILSLIKVLALFHLAQRPVLVRRLQDGEEHYIMATRHEYEFVMELWRQIRETTETSAPGHIIRFYHEVVEELAADSPGGFYVEDLTDRWNSKFEEKRSSDSIRKWVEFLCEVGYLTKERDAEDKRRNLLRVIRSEKNGNYTKIDFSVFFKLETFKAWLNEANQILEKNEKLLKEKFFAESPANVEDVYEKFFLCKNGDFSNISSSQNQASTAERNVEKTENEKIVQFPNFHEAYEKMRREWRRGAYTEFDELAVRLFNCRREDAERFRVQLLEEGKLAFDPEGWLVWT